MPTREEGPAAQPEHKGHLYQGEPDRRQDTSGQRSAVVGGLFRKRYGRLEEDEIQLQDAIKDKAEELAALIGVLNPAIAKRFGIEVTGLFALKFKDKAYDPAGVTLAIRHLEDAVYRAVRALTA